jgi:uncharacterized membrane protein YjdF
MYALSVVSCGLLLLLLLLLSSSSSSSLVFVCSRYHFVLWVIVLLLSLLFVCGRYQVCPVGYLYFSIFCKGSVDVMYVSYTCFEVGCTPIVRRSVDSTGQLKVFSV